MDPRISLVSLGVADLARARRFYVDGLGWAPAFETPQVLFIQMGGMVFGLWDYAEMARELALPAGAVPVGGMSLAHNVCAREDVDPLLVLALRRGGRLVKAAADQPWGGRSGTFADPDGHLWEVAWNPAWPLDSEGRVRIAR